MSLQGEGHPTRDGEAGNIGRRENSRSTFKALGPRPPPASIPGSPFGRVTASGSENGPSWQMEARLIRRPARRLEPPPSREVAKYAN